MSKELEALNYLVNLAVVGNKEKHRGKVFDSEEMVLEALKRNEPMKVDLAVGTWDTIWFVCPKCRGGRVGYEDEYCYNCGQKLDWEKENE